MINKIKQKIQDKKGMSTLEFVICMLIFVMVTAFIVDLFIVTYKHYEVSANCTKAARVLAIQGGLDNELPENYPGGASNYMTNREFKTYLDELATQVQGDVGDFKVYIGYSYIDNYDNVITQENKLIYTFSHKSDGTVSKTYFPQRFLLPYGSVIDLTFEYTYEFWYTNRWFEDIARYKFHSNKSIVSEYVSYDYGYHINGQPILTVMESLPPLNMNINASIQATDVKYFTHEGNAITGLTEEGKNAQLTDIVFPANINGDVITRIASGAFADNTRLQTLVIPANIEWIGSGAFAGCTNLHTIRYYEGLERIDSQAFANCTKLKNFTPAYSFSFLGQSNNVMILPRSLEEINEQAFLNCILISEVRMGEKVVKIAENAFNGTNNNGPITICLELKQTTDSSGNWIQPIVGAPWKQIQSGGTWVADTSTTVRWGVTRG